MSAKGRRPPRPAPEPKGEISKRLEKVREDRNIPSLKDFWRTLGEENGCGVGYEAVRNYHYDRDPPASYLARVVEVWPQYRLEWLVRGEEPPTHSEATAAALSKSAINALRGELKEMAASRRERMNAALSGEVPAMAQAEPVTRERVGRLVEVWRMDDAFFQRTAAELTGVTEEELKDVTAQRVVSTPSLAYAIQEAAVREVGRALRAPADAAGVDLTQLSPTHFDLYIESAAHALRTLLLRPDQLTECSQDTAEED